tara:strand:+ start:2272 stop:3543 length:1272 start_codon:yes stop_codon:yes gene_type:complete
MIDKIINEWTYQLEVGYPTKESDYEVLRSVLQETNMLSEQEIHNTVLQAQGIFESKENTDRISNDIQALRGAGPNPIYVSTDSQIIINNFNKRSKEFKLGVADYLRDNNIESDIDNRFRDLTIDTTTSDFSNNINADGPDNNTNIFKGGSPEYDAAIRSRLGLDSNQPIPQVTRNYILDAGPISLEPADADIVRRLWPEHLDSSIIGKGEISVYWLYQYQNPPKKTIDLRGDDNPDLNIAGSNVEVKSYKSHKERISLGRFGKFKESIRMISILFGIQTLTNLFTEDKKVYSMNSFNSKDLIASFKSLQLLDSIQGKQELVMQFPIFKNMYDQINELKLQLNLQDGYTDIEGAAAIMRRLLFEKFKIKPGNNGYIINLTPKDPSDIYAFEVDLESIADETMLANVTINGASIEVNYNALFGKG